MEEISLVTPTPGPALFRSWLDVCLAPSHYQHQHWRIISWTLMKKRLWNPNTTFTFKKMHLKMPSAKWQLIFPEGDELTISGAFRCVCSSYGISFWWLPLVHLSIYIGVASLVVDQSHDCLNIREVTATDMGKIDRRLNTKKQKQNKKRTKNKKTHNVWAACITEMHCKI